MLTPSLQSRLDSLAEYTRDLREIRPPNLEAFRQDKMLRRYAERMLHMAIETCIHIGADVAASAGFRQPDNFHDIFIVLGDNQVLPPGLVTSMTMLTELRNLLVYQQDAVDDTAVYGALKKRTDDLDEYARYIEAFVRGERRTPAELFEGETS